MTETIPARVLDAAWDAFRAPLPDGSADFGNDTRRRVEAAVRAARGAASTSAEVSPRREDARSVPEPMAEVRSDGDAIGGDPTLLGEVRDAVWHNHRCGEWKADLPALFVRIERALVAASAIPSTRVYEALDHLLSTARRHTKEPRIVDLCQSVFMTRTKSAEQGGGRASWLEDMRPVVVEKLQRIRAGILAGDRRETASDAGGDPGKLDLDEMFDELERFGAGAPGVRRTGSSATGSAAGSAPEDASEGVAMTRDHYIRRGLYRIDVGTAREIAAYAGTSPIEVNRYLSERSDVCASQHPEDGSSDPGAVVWRLTPDGAGIFKAEIEADFSAAGPVDERATIERREDLDRIAGALRVVRDQMVEFRDLSADEMRYVLDFHRPRLALAGRSLRKLADMGVDASEELSLLADIEARAAVPEGDASRP